MGGWGGRFKRGEIYSNFSCVQLTVTPWTVALQGPLSVVFSRQEYWSRLPCPPAGDVPDPGIKPVSPVAPELQVDSILMNLGSLYIYNYD